MNPNAHPPRWADWLLEWFCAPHLLEEVQGDLHERYLRDVPASRSCRSEPAVLAKRSRFHSPFCY